MKNIKILRIMIIIVIIIIIILILMLNINNVSKDLIIEDSDKNYGGEILLEKNDNGFEILDDYSMFFTVWNSFNNYIDVQKYHINEDDNIDNNPYLIKSEEDRKFILFSMLDENYKLKKNINSEKDIITNMDIDEQSSIIPIEIKVKYGKNINEYIIDLYIEDIDKKILNERFFIIRIDNRNSTFSVEPVEGCSNIDEIKVEENIDNIKVNKYNKYYFEQMSNESIIRMYLQKYEYMSVSYPQIFYEKYLDKEYREKRFITFENFKKYIEDNKSEILNIKPTKYSIESEKNGNNEYTIIDQNENVYIFKEKSIMNFTVKLDTYTITTDTFKETYENATDEQRIQMNIGRFMQMINRQDYITSYSYLADSFKNNYFQTKDNFEKYIKENFFLYNKITYKSIKKEFSNLYSCELYLKDLTNKVQEIKSLNIVMKLEDDMNFKISFSIE